VKLYNDGLIYKSDYLVNYCVKLGTALSDEEIITTEENINLYYINYNIEDSDEIITIATTRPETILADVALAFNLEDPRYINYKNKFAINPLTNNKIPIIADSRILMNFGSGILKITPGHDKLDYEIAKTHNLPIISIFDRKGKIYNTITEYDNIPIYEARKIIIAKLEEMNKIEKCEKIKSNIPRCYRSNDIIEQMISTQWFIKTKPLAKLAVDMLEKQEVEFIPAKANNIFKSWAENIKDWCISRQLWWGHQIPVYYCSNKHQQCLIDKPEMCNICESTEITQDPDCLDTWNSSWLWSFATFTQEDFEYYFPLDIMVTGIDILFFWIMRMMMASGYLFNKPPFKKVYFHGIIRDQHNKKMSKSSGNTINPTDIINKYGVDPMRFAIMMSLQKDDDTKITTQIFELGNKFCTKLWNICRFLKMKNIFNENDNDNVEDEENNINDEEIMKKLQLLINKTHMYHEKMEFQNMCRSIYDFTYDDFANNYLEFAKDKLTNKRKKQIMLIYYNLIKLLHPIIPHITEEIWEIMGNSKLYIEKFPE
jgi:valyl-tRNA synthetase